MLLAFWIGGLVSILIGWIAIIHFLYKLNTHVELSSDLKKTRIRMMILSAICSVIVILLLTVPVPSQNNPEYSQQNLSN